MAGNSAGRGDRSYKPAQLSSILSPATNMCACATHSGLNSTTGNRASKKACFTSTPGLGVTFNQRALERYGTKVV
jgi:hypothetical protein